MNNIHNDLKMFLEVNNISQSSIARALSISPAAISTFIKGEYKGNNEELGKKIKLYIDNFTEKHSNTQIDSEIFISNDYKMSLFVINEAYRDKQIALITGQAGSGKSTILREYAKAHPNAILIEATLHTTAKVLLQILCERLHVSIARNLHDMVVNIARELKKRDVIILIDEAEHLPLRALEDLRRIWDFSKTPLILAGTEILMRNLMGKSGELRQLYSRIDGKWHLSGLTKEECINAFDLGIYEYTKGNFRSSSKLYAKAKRLASLHSANVCKEVIEQASSMIIL